MPLSPEKQKLIADAKSAGLIITAKQIDRWRDERLIPRPAPVSRGRGGGVGRPTPPGTLEQIRALMGLLAEDRSLDRAALRLWLSCFDVPIARVREALDKLTPRQIDPEKFKSELEEFPNRVGRRKRTPARVRKMARDGELLQLMETMLKIFSGKSIAPEEQAVTTDRLMVATGLDRARTDAPPGGKPWLTSNPHEMLDFLFKLPANWMRCVDQATDAQLIQARTDFSNFEKLKAWAAFNEELRGPNIFGFGSLTTPMLGTSPVEEVPHMFVAILYLGLTMDDVSRKLEDIADTADNLLQQLQAAMAAQGISMDGLRKALAEHEQKLTS